MLFCDLTVNGAVVWSGVPCLNSVPLKNFTYLNFDGDLLFVDTMGLENPDYPGLDSRFVFIYFPSDGSSNIQIQLQAVPSQQLSIVLANQNCVISIYEADVAPVSSSYVYITAPATAFVTDVLTAVAAPPMAAYSWAVTNATILSGQGTSTIIYQALSVLPVVITLTATLPTGGTVTATAVTIIYDLSAFAISAPEYVWAGQFGIAASVAYAGLGLSWQTSGAVRVIGPTDVSGITVDAGEASQPASLSTLLGASIISTWNFKIVPYTSVASYVAPSLAPAAFADFTMDLGWKYVINSMTTDHPALLRVYETAAARSADGGRSVTTDPDVAPTDATAIVFEGETSGSLLSFSLEHSAVGVNGDAPRTKTAYCRLFNMDAGTQIITLALNRTELQVSPTF